jgi:hypothetical protein
VGGRIDRTSTVFFVHKHEIPQDRLKDVTYIKFAASVCTEKDDPHRIWATLGGNLIHYPDNVGTLTADLLLIKKILNSVILSNGAKVATAHLSNFYLMTPLKQHEYRRVKMTDISDKIINKYKLHEKATDGWVHFKVVQGMYGLPQAGSNSRNELEERLNKKVISKALLSLPYGSARHTQLNLYWLSTILESNTSQRTIWTTWPKPSKKCTTSRLIPMGKNWWKLS